MIMTVGEFKKKVRNPRVLIDKTHLTDFPEYDLSVSDVNYIRNRFGDDTYDMMYAFYKLGFARGVRKTEYNGVDAD